MGFLQVTSRIGAAAAPWVAKGLLLVSEKAPFVVMGGTALIGSLFLVFISETAGRPTLESSSYEDGGGGGSFTKKKKNKKKKFMVSDSRQGSLAM